MVKYHALSMESFLQQSGGYLYYIYGEKISMHLSRYEKT